MERRDRLEDGVIIGEGMKGLDKKLAVAFFDVKKANCTVCNSSAGLKDMEQFVFAIASLQLGLDHPKKIGGNGFAFAFCSVANGGMSIDRLVILAADRRSCDSPALWELLVARAHNLGQYGMVADESNHVTIGCDVDSSGVFGSLNVFGSKDLEELWVNGPSEEMQRMFCDSGTDRKHVGTFRRGMSWAGRDYSTRIMGQPISTSQLLYHEFFSFADFVPPLLFFDAGLFSY